MDLRIGPSALTPPAATGIGRAAERVAGSPGSFATALQDALRDVSAAQNASSRLQRETQMENPAVSLEETMLAMQKAQIGFQAVLNVRNRMVQAYSDIMNMQV